MRPQAGIRVSVLVLAAVAMTALGWFGLRLVEGRGTAVPEPGWLALVVMLALGVLVIVAGWQVKQVRDGKAERHVSPLRAARTLVLGQAAALTGAALVGWYLANVLHLLPDSDVESQRGRIGPFVVHVVVALALAVAGMVVQRWCRLHPRDDEDA